MEPIASFSYYIIVEINTNTAIKSIAEFEQLIKEFVIKNPPLAISDQDGEISDNCQICRSSLNERLKLYQDPLTNKLIRVSKIDDAYNFPHIVISLIVFQSCSCLIEQKLQHLAWRQIDKHLKNLGFRSEPLVYK